MAGYRRFVAYVYEYRKGKKENNCGFIRVEVRENRCRMEMHLQCPGLAPEAECRVYGFLRNGGLMEGYLLGTGKTTQGRADGVFETDSANMGGSGIALTRMGGMIIRTESGAFFGTEWDDQPVRPENFKEMEIPSGDERSAVREPEERNRREQERENGGRAVPEGSVQEDRAVSEENAPEPASDREAEAVPEERASEPAADQGDENVPETRAAEASPEHETAEEPKMDMPDLESQSVKNLSEAAELGGVKVQREPEERREDYFLPFDDEEIRECRKIHPKDLMQFMRKDCALRNNRFLQYGYYNFGHLLVGKRPNGQYILGVPGGYDQQERFMANMFGFPYFKESRQIQLPKGRGGYWYRLINAPDFHQRNGGK